MDTPVRKIGFIGLRIMGAPMAGQLIAAGHEVYAYSRSGIPDPIAGTTAIACHTPREVETRTDGRYQIKTSYNGALGGEREYVEAVQLGTQKLAPSIIIAGKFEQVQKHISLTGHVYPPRVWLMNPDTYAKLSDADKQAFFEAAVEGTKANRARVGQDDANGVQYLSKGGTD